MGAVMKNKLFLSLLIIAIVLFFSTDAQTALTTIGTANYQGDNYNLIWDNDNNGKSIVWLDYTNGWYEPGDFLYGGYGTYEQEKWIVEINSNNALTYNINDEYEVSWINDWRLPKSYVDKGNPFSGFNEKYDDYDEGFGYEGPDESGYHDYQWGYNMVNSEIGHLYYEELGNLGYINKSGNMLNVYDFGLNNTGDFDNLDSFLYWILVEGTTSNYYTKYGYFDTGSGIQYYGDGLDFAFGIPVREGDVSVVPVPGAVWLLGSGLIGLLGFKKKNLFM
jgi:hypothetical protein